MRQYIYKILIAAITLIVVFEFTLGKAIDKINNKIEIFSTKEGRKEMVVSIKNEMEKAIKKDNYLDEDERILIRKFISKIKSELNSVE
jgi:hypothetical protein